MTVLLFLCFNIQILGLAQYLLRLPILMQLPKIVNAISLRDCCLAADETDLSVLPDGFQIFLRSLVRHFIGCISTSLI